MVFCVVGSIHYVSHVSSYSWRHCVHCKFSNTWKQYFGVSRIKINENITNSFLKLFYKNTRDEICIMGQNITKCPLCDNCSYFNLSVNCNISKIAILFDNSATLFFAIFMSLWAVCFLEYWKRYNFRLAYDWNCLDFEEDEVKF